jgi:hypothetical protein
MITNLERIRLRMEYTKRHDRMFDFGTRGRVIVSDEYYDKLDAWERGFLRSPPDATGGVTAPVTAHNEGANRDGLERSV